MSTTSSLAKLDAQSILAQLGHPEWLTEVNVIDHCGSTNTEMAQCAPPPIGCLDVLVARHQHAGRGRRGRHWHSDGKASLTFSCTWSWSDGDIASPTTLPLVIGLAVTQAIKAFGFPAQLKWPNDVLLNGRKLAGILVELHSHWEGKMAVIGCGLNLSDAPATSDESLDAASLDEQGVELPEINRLFACILTYIHQNLTILRTQGFNSLREQWQQHDAFAGKAVVICDENAATPGICCGIDPTGALQLRTPEGMRRILSGDVSVRSAT